VGITAGSREVPGRNACDRRHTYRIIIIIIIHRSNHTIKMKKEALLLCSGKEIGIEVLSFKQLTATHQHIAALFNTLIQDDQIPEWLRAGVTFLIPKNGNTENPKNYRPVTCLPTIYKLITSIITRCMQKYMDDENLMPKEQKGCCSRSKGCKDQLLISKAILQECKHKKKNLCMAWIDYQKAFDRVPHSWIIKYLELIWINNKVITFTKKVMSYWRTRMYLHTENKLTETQDIKIQ